MKEKAEKKFRIIALADADDSDVGEEEVDAHVKALINAAANDPGTPVSHFNEDSAPAEKKFLAALIALNAAEDALAAAQEAPLVANAVPDPTAAPLGASNFALLVQKIDALKKQNAAVEKQMAVLLAAADPDVEMPDSLCVTGANYHPSHNRMLKAQGKPELAVDAWTGVYTPFLQNGKLLLINGKQLYQLDNEDKFLCYNNRWLMQSKKAIMAKTFKSAFKATTDTPDPTDVVWERQVYTVNEDGKDTSTWAEFDSMGVQPFTNQPVYVTDSKPLEVDLSGLYEPTGGIRNGVPVYQLHGGNLVLSLSTEFNEHGNYVIAKPATAAGESEKIYYVLDISGLAKLLRTGMAHAAHTGSWKKGMFAVAEGRVGQLTMNPDKDYHVKLKYTDGSTSGYMKATKLKYLDGSTLNNYIRTTELDPLCMWKSCNYTPDGGLAALPEHAKPGFTCEPSVSLY